MSKSNLPTRPLAIKGSKIHGFGIFATRPFKRGDYIATIKGSKVMYKAHFKGQSNRYHDWIGHGKNKWIDPVDEFQYVNHSSDPSAGIMGSSVLKVYALKDIAIGDEVTIDYSIAEDDDAFEFENLEPMHDKFRKIVGSIQTLPPEVYKSYLPFIPAHFRKVYENEVLSKHEGNGAAD